MGEPASAHPLRNLYTPISPAPVYLSLMQGDSPVARACGRGVDAVLLMADRGQRLTPDISRFTHVAVGDVDGDLHLAVGQNGRPNQVYVDQMRPHEAVKLAFAWTAPKDTASSGGLTSSLAWGDIDGDGQLDLATANRVRPLRIPRKSGDQLGAAAFWSTVEEDATTRLAWGDVDGDGDPPPRGVTNVPSLPTPTATRTATRATTGTPATPTATTISSPLPRRSWTYLPFGLQRRAVPPRFPSTC